MEKWKSKINKLPQGSGLLPPNIEKGQFGSDYWTAAGVLMFGVMQHVTYTLLDETVGMPEVVDDANRVLVVSEELIALGLFARTGFKQLVRRRIARSRDLFENVGLVLKNPELSKLEEQKIVARAARGVISSAVNLSRAEGDFENQGRLMGVFLMS